MCDSVVGIISIPGMMTGAIIGGSSVEQAAKLQTVIMFMISACAALASIATTILALFVVIDSQHRIWVEFKMPKSLTKCILRRGLSKRSQEAEQITYGYRS